MGRTKTRASKSGHGIISPGTISAFQKAIYHQYRLDGRDFAWRRTTDPYEILVSEFMLQQTQTGRVVPRYEQFLKKFPDFQALAAASLRDVFKVWHGLGYNRRAKHLLETARIVVTEYAGKIPSDPAILRRLPGVGPATASAIAAFAFQKPVVFLETNIRRVFIHFFFSESDSVKDAEILPLIEATLDRSDPRNWYYALMDYGVMLKKNGPNANLRSAHYQKQAPFKGSNRQLRGAVLRTLLLERKTTREALAKAIGVHAGQLDVPLFQLLGEELVKKKGKWLVLPDD